MGDSVQQELRRGLRRPKSVGFEGSVFSGFAESRLGISRVLLRGSGTALNEKAERLPPVRAIKIRCSPPGDLLILLAHA